MVFVVWSQQKDEFLQALDLYNHGDKYLDGMEVAKILGVKLESPVPKMRKLKTDRKLSPLAVKLK